jgi:hypothetical protein
MGKYVLNPRTGQYDWVPDAPTGTGLYGSGAPRKPFGETPGGQFFQAIGNALTAKPGPIGPLATQPSSISAAEYNRLNPAPSSGSLSFFDPYAASGIKPPTTSSSGSLSFFDPKAASLDAQIAAAGPVYQANLEKAKQQFNQQPGDLTGGGDLLKTTSTGGPGSDILSGEGDWISMFQALRAAGVDAAEASQIARREAAQATYDAQLKNAQTAAKQNQLAAQQARQQIAEGSFTQERQLLQAASQRGLGGSGIEQLAQTQQRIGSGQQINQLVQQEMLGNEKLQNYLGDVEAQKNTKLAEADAQYYNDLFKLAGNDLENVKFLDSTQYRDKVFEWQKQNAADITTNNNLNTRLDLIRLLESPDLSDNGKKSVAAMMLEAGKIGDQEANDLLDQYLGTSSGEKLVKGSFDWTTAIATGSLVAIGIAAAIALPVIAGPTVAAGLTAGIAGAAGTAALGTKGAIGLASAATAAGFVGGTAAGGLGGGISGLLQGLSGNISFRLSDGTEWKGTRADAINKNNPNSVVTREFGSRQAFNDVEFVLDGTTVKYNYKGQSFDRFNDAQAAWLRQQGR